jgi:flavodoxin
MRKSLILYYSWYGNTEIVAKEIENQTGFDLIKIEESTDRPYSKLPFSAIGAFLGLKSKIKPMDFSHSEYENLFLGSQVWAGKTPPAINRYLSKAEFNNKKVYIFMTHADEKLPQNCYDSIVRRIRKKGGLVLDYISFTKTWNPENVSILTQQEIEKPIKNWLNKNELSLMH